MHVAAELPSWSGKSCFSYNSCSINSIAHIAAGPKLFSGSLVGEEWIGARTRPSSFPLFPSHSWRSTAKSRADGDLKGEKTRDTVRHVGCYRSNLGDFAKKSSFFHISMNLLCMCFRHNAKQESSFWVPTGRGRVIQLCDNCQDIIILGWVFPSGWFYILVFQTYE